MLDRELIRQSPEVVRASLLKRGEDPKLLDSYIKLEQQWREAISVLEPLRAEKNKLSRAGKPKAAELRKAQDLAKKTAAGEKNLKKIEDALEQATLRLPNLVLDDVPVGAGDSANSVIRQVGRIKMPHGKPHHELMTALGWLDLKTAANYSGSRFRYLKGNGAWSHLSLVGEALKLAVSDGFTPVIPPLLTRRETLEKAGFLPFAEDDIFKIEREDLYLAGTSEQTLLALAANHVFDEKDLPLRFVGFSSCFRREVGSYGKDVEGMFRTHQFDKVELVTVTTAEKSTDEHSYLVATEERFVKSLGLPYQVVMIGSGDLGATAAKKMDIEVWFPSQQRYRETHSASNCLDFQSRRLGIKYRDSSGQEHFAHTLNATLATERLLLAYVENNQRPDGSVNLPRRWQI